LIDFYLVGKSVFNKAPSTIISGKDWFFLIFGDNFVSTKA
jgi:hypothetical protein